MSRIIFKQSPRLAQCAACRNQNALRKTRPPMLRGRLVVSLAAHSPSKFTCMTAHRYSYIPTSWAFARARTNFGGNAKQEVGSGGSAMECAPKERNALSFFFSRNDLTESRCPIGDPRTRIPCAIEGRAWSSTHTVAFSFTILVAAVSSAHPPGSTPAPFQTFILP